MKISRKMIKFAKSKFNNQVFIPSILMILLITLFATIFPQYSKEFFQNLQNFITAKFGWFYVLAIAIIVVCMLILGFSKFGEIKLGADHAKKIQKYFVVCDAFCRWNGYRARIFWRE